MVIGGLETFDQNKIAIGFIKTFAEIGQKLASSISKSLREFKDFISVSNSILNEKIIQDNQLDEAFYSLKSDKKSNFNKKLSSVVELSYFSGFSSREHIFSLPLQRRKYPSCLMISIVSSIFEKR